MESSMIDRRAMILFIGGAAALPFARAFAAGPVPGEAVMWRDPGCDCCTNWARKVEASLGLRLRIVDSPDILAIKRVHAVPADLYSCHTARIGGYVIEGHVPPEDVRRLIAAGPADLLGLAAPGMPAGSPGMEGLRRDAYEVMALVRGGKRRVFSVHG